MPVISLDKQLIIITDLMPPAHASYIMYRLFSFSAFKTSNMQRLGSVGEIDTRCLPRGGGRGTPYDGLYGKAPPERGTFHA